MIVSSFTPLLSPLKKILYAATLRPTTHTTLGGGTHTYPKHWDARCSSFQSSIPSLCPFRPLIIPYSIFTTQTFRLHHRVGQTTYNHIAPHLFLPLRSHYKPLKYNTCLFCAWTRFHCFRTYNTRHVYIHSATLVAIV